MKTAWNQITDRLAQVLSEQLKTDVRPEQLITPPDRSIGDLAFACFGVAKQHNKLVNETAKELAQNMSNCEISEIESVSASGPYVNFTLNTGDIVHHVIRDIEVLGDAYGASEIN